MQELDKCGTRSEGVISGRSKGEKSLFVGKINRKRREGECGA